MSWLNHEKVWEGIEKRKLRGKREETFEKNIEKNFYVL